MTKTNGGPAFPRAMSFTEEMVDETTTRAIVVGADGMSLRDWFAGQCIGAVIRQCANDIQFNSCLCGLTPDAYFAQKAFDIADAMLAEREK